jgi:hypothetical protein
MHAALTHAPPKRRVASGGFCWWAIARCTVLDTDAQANMRTGPLQRVRWVVAGEGRNNRPDQRAYRRRQGEEKLHDRFAEGDRAALVLAERHDRAAAGEDLADGDHLHETTRCPTGQCRYEIAYWAVSHARIVRANRADGTASPHGSRTQQESQNLFRDGR